MSKPKVQRKLWSGESMVAAVETVRAGKGLREAARLYNVPVETLRRRVAGLVDMDCRPGPSTVLTKDEEDQLARYLIEMADMGYGLTREAVMHLVYAFVSTCGRNNPFKNEKAGRWWFQGFKTRHPNLTIRTPQPLSHCRALCSNPVVIRDFFGKLGAIYGKLNLISKPMQIYNSDETGISIVHKPGKVIAEMGRRHVYCVTSAEKGRTHTVLSCISASGVLLPPLMVYPRKKSVPENFKEGAFAGTHFANSESGWMNSDVYLEWFNFFLSHIPPGRPVLLIHDGHASHMSIELIELARANDVHILCLPAHTSHILQPLDVGVFKSFKSAFSKASSSYLSKHPGRVITTDILATLVCTAFTDSHTPNNIMGGFRKTGIFPLNPGAIDDKMLAPSKAFAQSPMGEEAAPAPVNDVPISPCSETSSTGNVFTIEQIQLYEKRYKEGYDVLDAEYEAWLKIAHPLDLRSEVCSTISSSTKGVSLASSGSTCSDILKEMLVLPQPKPSTGKRRKAKALNSKAVCITETEILEGLKVKAAEKVEIEKEKERKKVEREEKRKAKLLEAKKKKEMKELKKKEKELKKNYRKLSTKPSNIKDTRVEDALSDLAIDINSSSDEDRATCPICGKVYPDDGGFWIQCENCENWYDFKCTGIKSKRYIPDNYFCQTCK